MTDFIMSILMVPVPKGRPRFTRTGHTYTPKATADAEKLVAQAVSRLWAGEPTEEPLDVDLTFRFIKPKSNKKTHHSQRPDLDNLIKLQIDAMIGVIYKDDSQIVRLSGRKVWGDINEVVIVIRDAQ